MSSASSGWRVVALCLAFGLTTTGCDSGTTEERTGDEPGAPPVVDDDQEIEAKCTDPGEICPVAEVCDAESGKCVVPRCVPACEDGLRCDAATLTCVAPDPCKELSCDAGQKCYAYPPDAIPEDGDRATCIANCSVNADNEKVECDEGRRCNPSNGLCECPDGPCPGDVGTECNDNDDCLGSGANRRCLSFFEDGYCSSECGDSDCPPGSACVDYGDFLCLDLCSSHSDCRDGYRCETLQDFDECLTEGKVCIPVTRSSDCTGPDCVIPGQACENLDDCSDGGFCASAWPDGTCIIEGCDAELEGTACPRGSDCVVGVFNTPNCMMGCDVFTQDCRPGYWCVISNKRLGTGGCVPRNCDNDGDCVGEVVRNCDGDIIRRTANEFCDVVLGSCDIPCRDDFDCGATCLDMDDEDCDIEREGIGQGRRCNLDTKRCFTPCEDDAICGVHGYCDFNSGICKSACDLDSECPPGNRCSDDGRCKAPCDSDDACAEGEHCDRSTGNCISPCQDDLDCPSGLECRRRLERCVRPLDNVPVGDSCTRHEDCRSASGGICLLNRDGFPGGYCSANECSDIEECPRDSECRLADLPGGAGLVPACFLTCERRADCREDYSCTNGVCQPAGVSVVGPAVIEGDEGGAGDGGEGEGEGDEGEGEAAEGEGESPAEGEGEGEGENADVDG